MGKKYLDLLERTAWTAIQAFLGVLVGTTIVDELDWGTVFVSAGIAAGIAAAKCLLAFQVGNEDSAAMPETQP
jgi:hypothetical protein